MSLDPVQVSADPSRPVAWPRPTHRLGMASLALSIVAAGLEALAIAIGSGGAWGAATVLAWFVVGIQALSFGLGLVALLTGRGRRWGVAAVVVSLAANPLVLVGLFRVLAVNG